MAWRLFFFLLSQAVGGLAGWTIAREANPLAGALAGVVLGGFAWFLLDLSRGARLLRWLHRGDVSAAGVSGSVWGEVSDRARRLVRAKEQQTRDSDRRLREFLAALQASPNGVVMLDQAGRIEWFNQTAASHFGFDVQRDLLQNFCNLVRDPDFNVYYSGAAYETDVTMPGRANTPARPVKLSVQLHPYGGGGACCCHATSRCCNRRRRCDATLSPTCRTKFERH